MHDSKNVILQQTVTKENKYADEKISEGLLY